MCELHIFLVIHLCHVLSFFFWQLYCLSFNLSHYPGEKLVLFEYSLKKYPLAFSLSFGQLLHDKDEWPKIYVIHTCITVFIFYGYKFYFNKWRSSNKRHTCKTLAMTVPHVCVACRSILFYSTCCVREHLLLSLRTEPLNTYRTLNVYWLIALIFQKLIIITSATEMKPRNYLKYCNMSYLRKFVCSNKWFKK
jgi:hypothetical protein